MSATKRRNGFRHPKTRQEKRANIEFKNTGIVRGARFNLVDAYDDIDISEYLSSSWKNKRKQQYRTGNEAKYKKSIIKFTMKHEFLFDDYEFYHLVRKIQDFCRTKRLHFFVENTYLTFREKKNVTRKLRTKYICPLSSIETTIEWFGPSIQDIIGPRYTKLIGFCTKWKIVR